MMNNQHERTFAMSVLSGLLTVYSALPLVLFAWLLLAAPLLSVIDAPWLMAIPVYGLVAWIVSFVVIRMFVGRD
jgi:hypothetical protein